MVVDRLCCSRLYLSPVEVGARRTLVELPVPARPRLATAEAAAAGHPVTDHRCQGMDDLQSDLDVARNLLWFGWFVPSNSESLPRFPPSRMAAISRWAHVRQPRRVRVPVQRSRTAAEAEQRVFNRFPRTPTRTDINNQRGGRA